MSTKQRWLGSLSSLAAVGTGGWSIYKICCYRFTFPDAVSAFVGSTFFGVFLVKLLVILLAIMILVGLIGLVYCIFSDNKS